MRDVCPRKNGQISVICLQRGYGMNELKEKDGNRSEDYSFDTETSDLIAAAIAKKKEGAEKRRRGNRGRIIGICTVIVIAVCAAVYFGGWAASMGTFLSNTYINGIDVSGKNVSEACALVTESCVPQNVIIRERNGDSKEFTASDLNYTYDCFEEVSRLYKDVNHSKWLSALFEETFLETAPPPPYDEALLRKLLARADWGSTVTRDAALVLGDNGYYVEKEVFGDKPDRDKLIEYAVSEVMQGRYTVDAEKSGCYEDPKIFAADLEKKLEALNGKYDYSITYDFGYTTEVLTGAEIYEWLGADGSLDRSKAEKYVNSLAEKYDTFMTARKFQTTNRGVITMSQGRYSTGQYGWWTDREKTLNRLIDLIEKGESVTVEPDYVTLDTGYKYKGFTRSAEGDIGNTYVEVDLTAQHIWYYRDGVLEFETGQIVSGKATDPKRKTPEGVYSVYTKSTNYTLKAADGSYSAFCSYFMRMSFEGIGFHDLSRSAYGGDIYIRNGSHGCINMKYDEVKKLYELVERGTPVIMYY